MSIMYDGQSKKMKTVLSLAERQEKGTRNKNYQSRKKSNHLVAYYNAIIQHPIDFVTTFMMADALRMSRQRGIPSGRLREEAEKRRSAESENLELKLLVETLQHIERQSIENIRMPAKKELVKWRAAYDALTELGIKV